VQTAIYYTCQGKFCHVALLTLVEDSNAPTVTLPAPTTSAYTLSSPSSGSISSHKCPLTNTLSASTKLLLKRIAWVNSPSLHSHSPTPLVLHSRPGGRFTLPTSQRTSVLPGLESPRLPGSFSGCTNPKRAQCCLTTRICGTSTLLRFTGTFVALEYCGERGLGCGGCHRGNDQRGM